MTFNSFSFIIIFPLLFLLYYAIPARFGKGRNLFLLVVSYLLYMQWKPAYALVLMGVTVVTYLAALLLGQSRRPRLILTLGVILSLLPLLFFKYLNFLNEALSSLLSLAHLQFSLPGLNWAIPVGISFFTLQALGYLWDVYYKRQEVERDFLTYALFVSFFPSITSGPINKASLVIPQLKRLRPYFDFPKAVEGMRMLLWGLFMKVVVADRIAIYVDMVFSHYVNFTGMTCLVAIILFAIQIYADFAGYSLMALGVARVLGIDLTENFRRPFFATSVADLWRRWHISLFNWLKDYVYIPLGGSRCSTIRNYFNILVTFVVSGLWHGANWTYVIWGAMLGVFMCTEKAMGWQRCTGGPWVKLCRIVLTFGAFCAALIFFRMPTVMDGVGVYARIFDFSLPMSVYFDWVPNFPFTVMGITLLFLKDLRDEFFPQRFPLMLNAHAAVRWGTCLSLVVLILLTGVLDSDQFIYNQF